MADPQLAQQLQNNKVSGSKDKYDLAIDKYIEEYVSRVATEDADPTNLLVTPAMRKVKLKAQLKEVLRISWLEPRVINAFKMLSVEGMKYLEQGEFDQLITDLGEAGTKLDEFDFSQPSDENFQTVLGISDETMRHIAKVASAKADVEDFSANLDLFSLLAALAPDVPEYWYRVGVAAQKCGDIPLAVNAYQNVIALNPDQLQARLLIVDCYISQEQHESAKTEFEEAKRIAANQEADPEWLEIMNQEQAVLDSFKG